MSTVYFYDHIISLESVHVAIDQMKIEPAQRVELRNLLEEQVHYAILNMLLSELPAEDRGMFLRHQEGDQHDELWRLLGEKVDQVEDKIRQVSEELVSKMHQDIDELDGAAGGEEST